MESTKELALSKKMLSAIHHMKRNDNKMVRFPGGYWAREGWHSWHGPCWGTSTIEAIVRRGYAAYTVWKDGRGGKFPIECQLTELADTIPPEECSHTWIHSADQYNMAYSICAKCGKRG